LKEVEFGAAKALPDRLDTLAVDW